MQQKNDAYIFYGKPLIDVIELEIQYGTKKKWYTKKDGSKAFYWVEDKSVIVSDDFYRIPRNCCRSCKGDNSKPYKNTYFKEKYGSFSHVTKIKYSWALGYCEACAKAKAIKKRDPFNNLEMVSRTKEQLVGQDAPTYITVFNDGSIIESRDDVRAKCLDR